MNPTNLDLQSVEFTAELLASVPANLARRYRALPVFDSPTALRLAVADPSDLEVFDSLTHLLQRPLEFCLAEVSQLNEFIGRLYNSEDRR